jgi:hypothetical protein
VTLLMACGQLLTGIALRATPDMEWRRCARKAKMGCAQLLAGIAVRALNE